jgi:NAD(P)H-hydrate epimerase
VTVFSVEECPRVLPPCDLVIDAAYGTGFRGSYEPPDPGDAIVLSVDVPSGPVRADLTVTFGALKPSLLFSEEAGVVVVEDIGLDVSGSRMHVVEVGDVRAAVPRRVRGANKFDSGVIVVAGSPGMAGAARLTSSAAMRSGASYCRLAMPDLAAGGPVPTEVVGVSLDPPDWAPGALAGCERMRVLAIGPGLGRDDATVASVREVVATADIPVVVDADGLFALGKIDDAADVLSSRTAATILTPHDGEFARIAGEPPPAGPDRITAVRALATRLGATVLLKGAVTVVADVDGRVLLSTLSSPALATAGTGDVLTGVIAAFLARGLQPLDAAAFAATAHGAAALSGFRVGMVASDLLDLLPRFLSDV